MEEKEPVSQTYRLLERGQKCGHRYREEDMGQAHGEEGTERDRLLRGTGGVIPPTSNTHLITEDLDLADGSVYQALSACSTVIGINLQV